MKYTVVYSLNQALRRLLATNPDVLIMGQDIVGAYGGAFKVTKDLSKDYPDRVLSTPISEAAMTGMAAGMAMRGLRPIVEIMFGDFIVLCADQMINHIAKFRWVYNEKVQLPLVLRTPMGGRLGYGATHSQSLEKIFMGIPGWRIVAINLLTDPGKLLEKAVEVLEPVLFVENKWLYPKQPYPIQNGSIEGFPVRFEGQNFPTCLLSTGDFEDADITIVTYGGMAGVVLEAMKELLLEEEILCEMVVPTHIKPFNINPILDSLARTRNLLVFEEGTENFGWGREVIYQTSQKFSDFKITPRAIGTRNFPIPSVKKLEMEVLPQTEDVIRAVKSMLSERILR